MSKKGSKVRQLFGQITADGESIFASAFKEEDNKLKIQPSFQKLFDEKAKLKPKMAKPLPPASKMEITVIDPNSAYRIVDKRINRTYEIVLECKIINLYKLIRRRAISEINSTTIIEKQFLKKVSEDLKNRGVKGKKELRERKIQALHRYRNYTSVNAEKLAKDTIDEALAKQVGVSIAQIRGKSKEE